MSKIYVLVEGVVEDALLQPLVTHESDRVQFVRQAGGRYSMPSLAASMLATRQRPVVLVLDADSTQDVTIRTQKRDIDELLRMASIGVPYSVIQFVPTIESVLFAAPELLERVFKKPLTNAQRERANQEPRQVLFELARGEGVNADDRALELNGTAVIVESMKQANEHDLAELRKHPVVRELNDFLARVTAEQLQVA